jgi:hypothetical protein
LRFSTHFLVVSAKRDSLLTSGVLRQSRPSIRECLEPANLDVDRLRHLARRIATVVGIPETCSFAAAHAVNIFDFSCKGRLLLSCKALSASVPAAVTPAADQPLVLPIGDTLVNPFWPQGLGVNRGFHSALDAVWALYLDAVGSRSEAERERLVSYNMMMWLPLQSALVRSPAPPNGLWLADPLTRYGRKLPASMHFADASSLTPRMVAAIGNEK